MNYDFNTYLSKNSTNSNRVDIELSRLFEEEENYWKKNIIKLLSNNKKDLVINLKSRNKKIQKSLFKL